MPAYPRRFAACCRRAMPATLTSDLAEHARLLLRVKSVLPPPLSRQCRYCRSQGGVLIVQMESSAMASLLRFQTPAILERLGAEHGLHFTDLVIRNWLPEANAAADRPKPPRPSARAGEHLLQAAESCAVDEIKSALLRLGHTLTGGDAHA